LEALLFAETLQGTLSPNANPGKGSIGGLLNLMPEATGRIHRAAETLVHLSSTRLLYQSEWDCARGSDKKVMGRDFWCSALGVGRRCGPLLDLELINKAAAELNEEVEDILRYQVRALKMALALD
jgi:hypothetical protein